MQVLLIAGVIRLEQWRLFEGLLADQLLQLLELAVLLGQSDTAWLTAPMDRHFELEKINAFLPLDHLVVEFSIDKRPIDVVARSTSIHLIIWHQECIEVIVRDLRASVLKSAPLSLDHQDDQNQIASHIDNAECHHGRIANIVVDEYQEGDHLDDKIGAPEKLVCVPLFRKTSLILIHHKVAAKAPGEPLYGVENHKVIVPAPVDPTRVRGRGALAPANKDIDEVGGAHYGRDTEFKLEKVRVAYDTPLANVTNA